LATCPECCNRWRPGWRTSRETYPWWTRMHIMRGPSIITAAIGGRYAAGSVEVPHTTIATWSRLVALRCHHKLRTPAPRRRRHLRLHIGRRLRPGQQESSGQCRRTTPCRLNPSPYLGPASSWSQSPGRGDGSRLLALGGVIHPGHTASKLVRRGALPRRTGASLHLRWRGRLGATPSFARGPMAP